MTLNGIVFLTLYLLHWNWANLEIFQTDAYFRQKAYLIGCMSHICATCIEMKVIIYWRLNKKIESIWSKLPFTCLKNSTFKKSYRSFLVLHVHHIIHLLNFKVIFCFWFILKRFSKYKFLISSKRKKIFYANMYILPVILKDLIPLLLC